MSGGRDRPTREVEFALKQGDMIAILEQVESHLPSLLRDAVKWKSLDINYHPPRVERLWRQLDNVRVCLHKIHPCKGDQALFHPHPWPSAMKVLSGTYEMAIGYGAGDEAPPMAVTMIVTGGMKYEMVDPDSWHYVRPIDDVAMTLMVTGHPWSRSAPGGDQQLSPVSERSREEMLRFFREKYPE